MKRFTRAIVKARIPIIVICALLMIPSIMGYVGTKINYDLVTYLPSDVETMKGQKILSEDFKQGAFSVIITENMSARQILDLEKQIKEIKTVNKVGSVYDVLGYNIPIEILPDDVTKKLHVDNSDLIIVTFTEGTSDDDTLNAVKKIKTLSDSIKASGMSATSLDTAQIAESEVIIYVTIAVALCLIVLMLALDSFFVPILLLGNIGVAIVFNMGTNIFFGQISYITKAIAAVLQLGVTTDFSIFLYHKYEAAKKIHEDKTEAMAEAIEETMISVVGSSLTTIAGFLALCTMTLTLGTDIGLVMAKGVVFGVICVLTLFPSLVLVCDPLIEKTSHRVVIPSEFPFLKTVIKKGYKIIILIFVLGLYPAYYAQAHTANYYNITAGLPDYLEGVQANNELKEKFKIVSPYFLMVDSSLEPSSVKEMSDKVKKLDGIDMVATYASLSSSGLSEDMLSDDIKGMIDDGKHQLVLVSSSYEVATDELNNQITEINKIVKSYDKNAIVCGEGPLMKDMVNIANTDFNNVNTSSILVVFVLMILVLRGITLPVLLVLAIEFAIFINMGIPFVMGSEIPFVASIVIGTIQLGATIDYAILMSTKYLEKRKEGLSKEDSIGIAVDSSANSILVAALCFFAATVGVGLYSAMDMISTLCIMMARGALISMVTVIFVVPSLLMVFDKLIIKTTLGFKHVKEES